MSEPQTDIHTPSVWAPWRMKYLEATRNPGASDCFLCEAAAAPQRDRETFVVLRRKHTFAILNLYPYTNGHTMVTPLGHLGQLADISDEAMLELMQLTRDCQAVLTEVMHPDGFNIGINVGRAAGAGLPGHLHIHIVPRWAGDANFMTAVGAVRIIPEALESTHAKLVEAAGRLGFGDGNTTAR